MSLSVSARIILEEDRTFATAFSGGGFFVDLKHSFREIVALTDPEGVKMHLAGGILA